MQQRPTPRERIIRPSAADHLGSGPVRNPNREPVYEEEAVDEEFTQEELTGDALIEWLTQKAINLEIRTFKLEKKVGIKTTPQQQKQSPNQPIPARRQQPYEERYTQDAPEDKPKKKRGVGKLIALFIAIILVGILVVNIIGILFFGYTLPF